MKNSLAYLALSLPLVGGCFGTETGNPPLTAELTVDAHSSDPARVAIDVDASDAVVEEAWVVVGDVQLVGDAGCDDPTMGLTDLVQLEARDHAAGAFERRRFETRDRDFCYANVDLELAAGPLPAGAPAELDGASIVLVGRRADGTPFRLAHRGAARVRLSATGGSFDLDADRLGIFLGFDVATWLGGVNLSSATVDPDGVIRISSASNTGLADTFGANVPAGIELYRDVDTNGEPDAPTPLARGDG